MLRTLLNVDVGSNPFRILRAPNRCACEQDSELGPCDSRCVQHAGKKVSPRVRTSCICHLDLEDKKRKAMATCDTGANYTSAAILSSIASSLIIDLAARLTLLMVGTSGDSSAMTTKVICKILQRRRGE